MVALSFAIVFGAIAISLLGHSGPVHGQPEEQAGGGGLAKRAATKRLQVKWSPMNKEFLQISANDAHAVAIDYAGRLFRLVGDSWTQIWAQAESQARGTWATVCGDGSVWLVDSDMKLWRSAYYPDRVVWVPSVGSYESYTTAWPKSTLVQVDCGDYSLWSLNAAGEVQWRSLDYSLASVWQHFAGPLVKQVKAGNMPLSALSRGGDGTVYFFSSGWKRADDYGLVDYLAGTEYVTPGGSGVVTNGDILYAHDKLPSWVTVIGPGQIAAAAVAGGKIYAITSPGNMLYVTTFDAIQTALAPADPAPENIYTSAASGVSTSIGLLGLVAAYVVFVVVRAR